MRGMLDEWHTYWAIILMALHIEKHLAITFTDDDLANIRTLRDLSILFDLKSDQASEGFQLTRWAVSQLLEDSWWQPSGDGPPVTVDGPLDWDAPLLDVIEPGRWERKLHR